MWLRAKMDRGKAPTAEKESVSLQENAEKVNSVKRDGSELREPIDLLFSRSKIGTRNRAPGQNLQKLSVLVAAGPQPAAPICARL